MRLSLISMLALALATSACRRVEKCSTPPPAPLAALKARATMPFEVVTMNAGLAPGMVHLASERAKPFAEMIGNFRDAGIVCLQETWLDQDRDRIIESLGLPKDQVFTVDTKGHNERPGVDICEPRRLVKLEACVRENCAGKSVEEVALCGQEECEWQLRTAFMQPPECGNCLAAMAGHSIDETLKTCTGKVGVSRVFGGNNGVILASKWPLKNRSYKELPASGANRVALFATVTLPGAGDIEVACTHMSSEEEAPPNQSDFVDWDEEKSAQLQIISDTLKARAIGRPSLLIGDLNVGPKLPPNISSNGSDTWKLAGELGFQDSASEAVPPFCSICDGNTLRTGHNNTLIDHVLRRQPSTGLALVPGGAWQVACSPVPITGPNGTIIQSNLSDHCGVRAKFTVEVPAP